MNDPSEQMRSGRTAATRDVLTIAIVLVLLALPALRATLSGWQADVPDELRAPAPFPALGALDAFPTKFAAFFDDRFGFRRDLIRAHNRTLIDGLHTSPVSRVLLGRDAWFYLRIPNHDRGQNGWIQHRQGGRRLTPAESRSWRQTLLRRSQALERDGIHYLFVVAPDKHTVYPEHLPATVSVRRRTALDQLAHGTATDSVAFLDLRPALRDAKPIGPLYWRTGTHWTPIGAKVVDDEIVKALGHWFEDLNPLPISAHRIRPAPGEGHGLARMLHLRDHYREPTPEVSGGSPPVAVQLDDAAIRDAIARGGTAAAGLRDASFRIFETNEATLPRAVVVVDSFGNALVPFLVEHFERVVVVHRVIPRPLLQVLIDWQQPDVVIEEIVERNLRGFVGAQ